MRPEQERWSSLANELDALQESKNDGRGVSCVQDVIAYLRMGRVEDARARASCDHDKVSHYPDIEKILKEKLFDGVDLYAWVPKTDKK